jgi:hypothetical protein
MAHENSKAWSSKAFAVEHAEMSKFLDASDNIKEMPDMKEFLDNMETEVCDDYVIQNKSETQSHATDPTILKLEST